MLIFLNSPFPALIIGALLILWGIRVIDMSAHNWLAFLLNLPFLFFTDETVKEKQELKEPAEEVVNDNPGCIILGLGLLLVIYGLFKFFM